MSKRSVIFILGCALVATLSLGARQAQPRGAREALVATPELLATTSRLRGLKILHPVKSGLKSRAEIEQTVIRNFEESTTPERIEATRKLLLAFALVEKDFRYREFMTSLLTEQVAGFYQPKTKEFFLADWNGLEQARPVIVHELVHALQDQHFDLTRFENWPRGDGDREMAIQALIEGDATALMFDYLLKPRGIGIASLPVSIGALAESINADPAKDREKVLSSAPQAIREALLFPYIHGAGFAQAIVKRQGWEGLTSAFRDLPQSTEQIIHPEKYFAREAPVPVRLHDISQLLGERWQPVEKEINGELGYFLILAQSLARNEARSAAAGWGGDLCALYEEKNSGRLLLVHLSAWDSEEDAGEFFRAYGRVLEKRAGVEACRETGQGVQRCTQGDRQLRIERRRERVLAVEGWPAERSADLDAIFARLWSGS